MLADDKIFVERVVALGKQYGWTGDYIEVAKFLEWLYHQYGLEMPPSDHFEPEE